MDKLKYDTDNVLHAAFIQYSLKDEEMLNAFMNDTGYDLCSLLKTSPIEKMIDEATGHDKSLMAHFIVWASENYWNTPDELEHIEAYKKAKTYINKKRMDNNLC